MVISKANRDVLLLSQFMRCAGCGTVFFLNPSRISPATEATRKELDLFFVNCPASANQTLSLNSKPVWISAGFLTQEQVETKENFKTCRRRGYRRLSKKRLTGPLIAGKPDTRRDVKGQRDFPRTTWPENCMNTDDARWRNPNWKTENLQEASRLQPAKAIRLELTAGQENPSLWLVRTQQHCRRLLLIDLEQPPATAPGGLLPGESMPRQR